LAKGSVAPSATMPAGRIPGGEPGKEREDRVSRGTEIPFGARLRRLRESAGFTQEELAARAGLTARGISDLERGVRKRPYPHTVRSISDALGLSEDERAFLLASVPRQGPVTAPASGPRLELPPDPPTPLVGRERELGEIRGLLGRSGTRLLTLVGTGGIGKTRLAIQAVREAGDLFSDGAVFVALAPVGEPALMLPTVAKSLGLREAAGHAPHDVLREYIREKRMLLVLDNFEHLVGAAPEVVALIEACPDLRVLATSRAPLRVRGEQEYPVSPLALPSSTRASAPDGVATSPSGRLFLQRARAVSPAFELTAANAAAVASICWRLDGLPLALELAAARIKFLDPSALLLRLDRALEAGGARDLPQRQRTMRATLDWSHGLLSKAAKDLFARLSVFSGGFTLEAAETVGEDEMSGGELDVLALLGSLVEHSLVLAEPDAGGTGVRYRMLEPVRQYALEKLEESGEAAEMRLRHAGYYLALAEKAEPRIKGWDQVEWLDRLEAENDNLRAAISHSVEADDTEIAARFGWALSMYWVMRVRHGEGRLLMEQTLASGDLPREMRAKALWGLAVCVYGSEDGEQLMAISEEGAALFRLAGDRLREAGMLGMMGFAALQLGDHDRATRVLEEALEVSREQDDTWGSAHILDQLAMVNLRRGDYPRAAGYAEEALALTRQTGDRFAGNIALHILAQTAWASDEHKRAARYLRESLAMAFELADKLGSAYCMQGLAAEAGMRGEARRVARLLGAAEALLESAGLILYVHARDDETRQNAASAARERLGEEVWMAARDEGRAMTFEEAVEYALEGNGVPSV
jgi:predicted ATPase/DNA-binding XRE family transcriptional regulator